jgi:hypothetical protein
MPEDSEIKELTSQEAKRLEKLYINRVRENIQSAGKVDNPLSGDSVSISFAEEHYEPHSRRKQIKEILEENEIYDGSVLDKAPRGRYFHYTVYEYGLFDKKAVAVISVYVTCEFADFVTEGKSSTPSPASEVESTRLDAMKEANLFHYIAVLGLCGFEEAAYSLPLSGPNWELALVTHVEGTAWKIISGEPERRKTVLSLFDVEKNSEKLWRAKSIITAAPELEVSGGFVILSDIVEESGLSPEIVKAAAKEFCQKDKSLNIETVEGKLIIKRSRT